MRVETLRIGNLLEHDGIIREVSSLHSDNTLRFKDGNSSIGCFKATISIIKPIELTEEILLKCPQIEKSDDYGDQKYFNLIGTKYFFCLDHDDFSFGIYNEKNNQSDITILNYFDLGISLHTFQNLIFALTNQELTFGGFKQLPIKLP